MGGPSKNQKYASLIKPTIKTIAETHLNPTKVIHVEPAVSFTMEEIDQFTIEEGPHQALLMKFSHDKLDMQELHKILPKYFGSQERCLIGWLAHNQMLVRCDRMEDYVIAAAKLVHYLL